MLICVTEGECEHVIDFKPVPGKQGSLFLLQPSQAEQFDLSRDWDGWLILFRPEFLFAHSQVEHSDNLDIVAVLEGLPEHFVLYEPEYSIAINAIVQMAEDSKRQTAPSELNALMRYQLSALILRLSMTHRHQLHQGNASPMDMRRFMRFKQLVEQKFTTWHKVQDYAGALGCSEKSVTRATHEVIGTTAKIFIANRISLEAKRLLTHTASRIASISEQLGFDEPTNFIKFFKRESGCTPAEFRLRQREQHKTSELDQNIKFYFSSSKPKKFLNLKVRSTNCSVATSGAQISECREDEKPRPPQLPAVAAIDRKQQHPRRQDRLVVAGGQGYGQRRHHGYPNHLVGHICAVV
jgi:AraC-like DNA-binding protein